MTTRVSKEPERPRRFHRQSGWGDRNRQLPGPRWDAHDRGEQTTGDTMVSAREEFERVEMDGGESERPILPWHRRSSYEPDAPARGVPQSPRWRVGLVCAKDANLSCRGNIPPRPRQFSASAPSNRAGWSGTASLGSPSPLSPPVTASDALLPTGAPLASGFSPRRNTTPPSKAVPKHETNPRFRSCSLVNTRSGGRATPVPHPRERSPAWSLGDCAGSTPGPTTRMTPPYLPTALSQKTHRLTGAR